MKDYFIEAYKKTMAIEGGYSNSDNDPGGETWKGIARNRHPSWEGWAIIDKTKINLGKTVFPTLENMLNESPLLEQLVLKFYRTIFWEGIWGDKVSGYSPDIALELFDTSVNLGQGKAIIFLQQGLNILNRNGKAWQDIPEDGLFGSRTFMSLFYCLSDTKTGESALLKQMNIFQGSYYQNLMRANPERFERYLGWFERIAI